ncbi:hypothetical protein SAMN04487770_101100 [Butyrivibrio sp. ob235]|uniref:hypothetical protein n=1 Tax=Butyrivibrio sp. ob235 TaxID=1761780 RepID=UPI0008D2F3E9|nr:hypothetical protein [Butyrivibrio sp. ob235]SEK27975.1 hypothetical protein SAMN04487770_101100 [Butyrivibrio sp. ob235]
MKLEKTWMGICVWVIYFVGMLFAIGVTGFVSGLFPYYGRYYVAGGFIIACLAASALIGFLANLAVSKVISSTAISEYKKPLWLEIFLPLAIIIAGIIIFGYTSALINDYTGNMNLYNSAVVAASGQETLSGGMADRAYVGCLKVFMGFLGNSLNSAYMLNLVLRIFMVIFLYISLRKALGLIPAFLGAASVVAIPTFGYSLKTIDSMHLIGMTFFLLLMLTVFYVKGFTKNSCNRWYYKIFSILLGAFFGLMIYLEASSAAIIVFLVAAWVLSDMYCETFNICLNEIILLVSGVLSFGGMLILEGGYDNIPDTYFHWTWRFFGYNENAWLLMVKSSAYNTYLAFGLLTLALIPAVLYLIKRDTKICPLLMLSVLGIVCSVFLGDTIANSEVMIVAFVVIMISCGISAIIHVREFEPVEKTEKTEKTEEPETIENIEKMNDSKEKTPRYVPEGMVLPVGEEDEEDIAPHFNMNRPEMAAIGILSVGTAVAADKMASKTEENVSQPLTEIEEDSVEEPANESVEASTEEPSAERKDDFDLNIAPDDDFDI